MAVAVGYGIFAGLVLIVFGRSLSMMFLSRDNVEVLDASAKYLRCMGFFYWSLGILNVSRMVTQGLGFSGRAFFSGVTEMIARIIVSVWRPLAIRPSVLRIRRPGYLPVVIFSRPVCTV